MRKYNINANLFLIGHLYTKDISAVQVNISTGKWFRTKVGVRKGCLPLSTVFNIFLERIMSETLEEYDGNVSIGGRTITSRGLLMTLLVLLKKSSN